MAAGDKFLKLLEENPSLAEKLVSLFNSIELQPKPKRKYTKKVASKTDSKESPSKTKVVKSKKTKTKKVASSIILPTSEDIKRISDDTLEKFRIPVNPPKQTNDSKNYAKPVDVEKGVKNKWKPPVKVDAADSKFDKKVRKGQKKGQIVYDRREAIETINVECDECHKPFEIYPADLRPKIKENGIDHVYVCDKCFISRRP